MAKSIESREPGVGDAPETPELESANKEVLRIATELIDKIAELKKTKLKKEKDFQG